MSGWARWLDQHVLPFAELIGRRGIGVVVMSIHLRYLRRFGFFDSPWLDVETSVRPRPDGAVLVVETNYEGGGRRFAELTVVLRTVRIDPESLAAAPAELPADLLGRFTPEELAPAETRPRLRDLLATVPAPSATRSTDLTISRAMCEVADQWSFIELPAIVERGRELIAMDPDNPVPALVGQPMEEFVAELRAPLFAYDEAVLETGAVVDEDRWVATHVIRNAGRGEIGRVLEIGRVRHG